MESYDSEIPAQVPIELTQQVDSDTDLDEKIILPRDLTDDIIKAYKEIENYSVENNLYLFFDRHKSETSFYLLFDYNYNL